MSKRALLVGINDFREGIRKLKGCVNDTADMQQLLTSSFGFQDTDIKVLHNAQASAQGIRDGLAWLLSDYTGADVRVFHFSSHGTQVDDQSGDEWECKDEVIVPYDHDWDKPFRDDDLRAIFEPIPPEVNFTFIADCCHSGSIQKGLLDSEVQFTPRYLTPPAKIMDRIAKKIAKRDAEADAWAATQLAEMLESTPKNEWVTKMQEYLGLLRGRFKENKYAVVPAERHVLLAACEDRQTAADAFLEGTYRGAFTWALGKAVREANGDLTYAELISRASANLDKQAQKPQLECPPQMRGLKFLAPLA
jgi:hypothetical protein